MTYELIFPVDDANKALRDGKVDFVGGSAHSTLAGFPEWEGAKLVCALSQGNILVPCCAEGPEYSAG